MQPLDPLTPDYDGTSLHPTVSIERNTRRRVSIFLKITAATVLVLLLLGVGGFFFARHWMQDTLRQNLPVIDGSVKVAGLSASVTVQRDAHGVPHIAAASVDDLVFAQGYVTASDRLWQMDALRRHAAGELAEVLGKGLVKHDAMERTLQLRAAADRALAVLPTDQMHWLNLYARGVNASMDVQRAHLPLEFRILRYEPKPWTPRDSLLVGLAMFQDLTLTFPGKLDREALSARLAPELLADLYPIGSWRDHPPGQLKVDLTAPRETIDEVPLDESQSSLKSADHVKDLIAARAVLADASSRNLCAGCVAGSNGWAVSGTRTRSGKAMLSSDMHLRHGVPGVWYEADLKSPGFHVDGVTLPGTPFVIVGHNDHIAWGFTNTGADVQDLYIEQTRGKGDEQEFEANDGSWLPMLHQREVIHVKGGSDVVLDVTASQHGGIATPVVSGLYEHERRTIALQWTVYDPANVTSPFYGVNAATDWASLLQAMSGFGGPSQNMQYADDQGHIGYHAIGKIPVRGSASTPAALSGVPVDGRDPAHAWVGYIPWDQMPQAFDPPGGILATANSRIVPDGYSYPITLEWSDPYRNERIWKVLGAKNGLAPADMLALQTDVYSDLDRVIAQRLTYSIDHSNLGDGKHAKQLKQAADLMRSWDGTVSTESPAAAIVDAARAAFWPLILAPQLGSHLPNGAGTPSAGGTAAQTGEALTQTLELYEWGEKAYAEEQIIVNQPARWLPAQYQDWNALLADAVERGMKESGAPDDLSKWRFGRTHRIDIEHPIYSQSPLLQKLLGMRTGTGEQPQSGDGSTVKQVGTSFGPSERLTVDFGDLDHSTLNIVLGESADPASEWFMDQWPAWYSGTTFAMPFSDAAVQTATKHTLTLVP